MMISWLTPSETETSEVEYGQFSLNKTASDKPTRFIDGGTEHRVMWMHHVSLTGLFPDTRYCKLGKYKLYY